MGVAYYIETDRTIPEYDNSKELIGKAIARADNEMTTIYKKLKITPLIDFFGQDQSEFMDELNSIDQEELPWFEPEDGLKTVDTLLEYLQEHPAAVKNIEGVNKDLQEIKMVLEACKRTGIRWHLALDI